MGSQYFHRLEDALRGLATDQQPRETRSNAPSCLTAKTYRVTSTLSKTVRTSFTSSQITTKSFWFWKVSVAFESVMRQGESKPVISCLSLEIQFTGLSWTADVLPCCPSSHRFSTERKRISGGRGTHSYDGHARDRALSSGRLAWNPVGRCATQHNM